MELYDISRYQKTLQGPGAFKRRRRQDGGAPRCEQKAERVTGLEEYGGVLLLQELKAALRLRVVCRPDVDMQLFCGLLG